MERTDLIHKLELVKPALSSKDIIPVFTHFMFTGEAVMAYNDVIAITTVCPTNFSGAVHGKILLDLLKNSTAKEVDFKQQTQTLHVKMGASRLKLPLIPKDKFLFTFPDVLTIKNHFYLNSDYLKGLDLCMISTIADGPPQVNGVTIQISPDAIRLYSTDNQSISCCFMDYSGGQDTTIVLPVDFVKTLLNIAKEHVGEDPELAISDGFAVTHFAEKEGQESYCRMYTKLKLPEDALDFDGAINGAIGDFDPEQLLPIPRMLANALARSSVIASTPDADTTITVKDGYMVIHTVSGLGEVKDRAKLVGPQEELSIKTNPAMLLRIIEKVDMFYITQRSVILNGNNFDHYIANIG